MPVTFFPFSSFQADGGGHGQQLDRMTNVLPVHAGHRSIPQRATAATLSSVGPVTGAYVHVFQSLNSEQVGRPSELHSIPAVRWFNYDGIIASPESIGEEIPDDTDFIYAAGTHSASSIRFSLAPDLVSPGSTSDHVVNWRYKVQDVVGSWTIEAILDDASLTEIASDSVTSSGDADWTTRSLTLSSGEAGSITWGELRLRFKVTLDGSSRDLAPSADRATGGWVTQAGAATDIYEAIDESSANDSDYIVSQKIAEGETKTYICDIAEGDWFTQAGTHTVKYRTGATEAGIDLTVTLLKGSTVIATDTLTDIATAFTDRTIVLSNAEELLFANGDVYSYEDVRLKVEASRDEAVAATALQYARPDADLTSEASDGWSRFAASGDRYEKIDEVSPDDGDYVFWSGSGTGILGVSLGSGLEDPLTDLGHVINVRHLTSPGRSLSVALLTSGGSLIASWTIAGASVSEVTDNLTLTEAQAASIGSYADLQIQFTTTDANVRVTWVELACPAPRRARISYAALETPSTARAQFSWAEFRSPSVDSQYIGDRSSIYAGVTDDIYEVGDGGFTSVGDSGGYGGASTRPASWRYCSFGNNVIATNYVDPVQWREDNAGDFKDLMTSTDKPKARFCWPARSHLMLGGINLTGHEADEIWWSAFENPEDFDKSVSTQCDYQRLYATTGQIMGGVGGDNPIIFKRRSVYILQWLGGDLVWRPDLVSRSHGTPYASSIVEAGGYIYFWGGDCFYRMADNGGYPEAVGRGVISRYLTDRHSDGAIVRYLPEEMSHEDQVMRGSYDSHAGVILWTYQGVSDSRWQHSKGVAYCPAEDRWALLDISGANIAGLYQQPNVLSAANHDLRGTIGFGWDGTDSTWFRFNSDTANSAIFRTKIFPASMTEDVTRPMMSRIKGVMPIWKYNAPNTVARPPITVLVEAGQDPNLEQSTSSTYTSTGADERYWFPHDITGAFFRITVTVDGLDKDSQMDAFSGMYIDYQERGE